MRHATLLALSLLLVVGPVSAQETPHRKSGLWELTRTSTYTENQPRHTKLCIAQASDNALRQVAEGMRGETCKTDKLTRDGDKLQVDATCTLRTSTATTHAVITGNFDSAYTIESKSTYNPPLAGQAKGQAVLSAKWTGPCPAGMQPGEMILNNGKLADSEGNVEEAMPKRGGAGDKKKGVPGAPGSQTAAGANRVAPTPKPNNPPPPVPGNQPAPSQ